MDEPFTMVLFRGTIAECIDFAEEDTGSSLDWLCFDRTFQDEPCDACDRNEYRESSTEDCETIVSTPIDWPREDENWLIRNENEE